ncbi:pyruvate kinase [Candidatus Foliamicus sp.]
MPAVYDAMGMRRTKIIATLGPATDQPEVLRGVMESGADVLRLNFSHGGWDVRRRRIDEARAMAEKLGRCVGLLGDLQGPKIRIAGFRSGSARLEDGGEFFLDPSLDGEAGDESGVGLNIATLAEDVVAGDTLLLDDGNVELRVQRIRGRRVHCRVVHGGVVSDQKGVNKLGGGLLSAPALTEEDRADLKLAAEAGLDWIAVSFVRDGEDIRTARQLIHDAGGSAHIIAKIERSEALDNLDEILDAADAVMVARGDLGIETGYEGLIGLQKSIIRRARDRHRVVITATQMMESMIDRPVPTRAEVSDVSNAVMDGSDAVMLSAESAVGEYASEAVAAMASICEGAEAWMPARREASPVTEGNFERVDEGIAKAAMYAANHMDVRAIVALTESGATALWMSRIRADIPIFALTRHTATQRRVTLYRGVVPLQFDVTETQADKLFRAIFDRLRAAAGLEAGDLVIITKGAITGVSGHTDSLTVLPLEF